MAFFIFLFILFTFPLRSNADHVYNPSSKIKSTAFNKTFNNIWGSQHQILDEDGTVTLILDDTYGGSGFKSRHPYQSGYFGCKIKLPDNIYTAGVDVSIYLSNNQVYDKHDEVDIEFLGHIEGQPYVLQTNVYIQGTGDGSNLIGREHKIHLWFNPSTEIHTYAILWNPFEIIFFVDDVPIRQYKKFNDKVFPMRRMWVYGSIWDASDWATDNGKYRANYAYQPFIAQYNDFKIKGCHDRKHTGCRSQSRSVLSEQQYEAMKWVQDNYLFYNYCTDPDRDHSLTPECAS